MAWQMVKARPIERNAVRVSLVSIEWLSSVLDERMRPPQAFLDALFEVDTGHGWAGVSLDDWIMIDDRGYPYPVAAEEFDVRWEVIE